MPTGIFGIDPGWVAGLAKGAAGVGTASKGIGGFSGLLQNKLFQQLLMGAGLDLLQNTPGKNVGAAFGQNLSSQGYLGILQKMLGGDFSAGGDLKVSSDGMKINIPSSTGTSGSTGSGTATQNVSNAGIGTDLKNIFGSLNPSFSLSGISAADLAGVDPQLITQALQFKFGQEELGTKRFSELVDASYKQGLLSYYDRQTLLAANEQELEAQKIAISKANTYLDYVKELGKDDRTTFQQDYEYAVGKGFEGSPAQWKVLSDDPGSWKEYQKTVAQGNKESYRDFLLRVKKSETNINLSPYERTMQTEQAQRESDVQRGDFAQKVTDKLSSDTFWDFPPETTDIAKKLNIPEEQAIELIKKAKILDEMDKQIRQAFANETVTEDEKGWYVNGKLIQRKP